ncbi:MAG: hypothetical protein JWP27_1040, partial [Flaviaesturariibacter sp.]|nr:hypothetical protein [Flaviaesturariibacter sp.]
RQTLEFIDGRLHIVSRELDSVTNALVAYQQSHNLTDVEGAASNYMSKVEEADKQLVEQRSLLNNAQLIQAYVSDTRNRFNLVPSSLSIDDPTLNSLISGYNMAQLDRKTLIEGGTPTENPRVKLKEEQLEKLRTSLVENLRNIKTAFNSSISSASQRNNQFQAQLRALPVTLQRYVEIKQQQENKLAIYNFLNEKREESAIALAATISNIKVLDAASPNLQPISPNSKSVKSIALLIGLIIPALFVFVVELMNDKVNSRADIEKTTAVTLLGEVGHAPGEDTLVMQPKSRSFIAEQFRIIRSNLQYIVADIEKPVLLITSSFSGEGKSFISTNIGAVLALSGKRTIVLEFDVRKPKILSGLNIPKRPGFTNFMLGKVELDELPYKVDGYDSLYVLPCGPIPPNPAELLLGDKMNELFTYLRANFDVVVMDTAPVGMVGDALTLSKFADCTIYIVRQGVTNKKQIELIEEFYTTKKLPKMNVILNDVKIRAGYGYYGYGRYGYGYGKNYGYGYGYYEDAKDNRPFLSRWFGWGKKKSNKSTA